MVVENVNSSLPVEKDKNEVLSQQSGAMDADVSSQESGVMMRKATQKFEQKADEQENIQRYNDEDAESVISGLM